MTAAQSGLEYLGPSILRFQMVPKISRAERGGGEVGGGTGKSGRAGGRGRSIGALLNLRSQPILQ